MENNARKYEGQEKKSTSISRRVEFAKPWLGTNLILTPLDAANECEDIFSRLSIISYLSTIFAILGDTGTRDRFVTDSKDGME
jgi:hypothetical protein